MKDLLQTRSFEHTALIRKQFSGLKAQKENADKNTHPHPHHKESRCMEGLQIGLKLKTLVFVF